MKITSINDIENLCIEWVKQRGGYCKEIEMTEQEYEEMCSAFDKLRVDEIVAFEKANEKDDIISNINRANFKPITPNFRLSKRFVYMGFDVTIKII
jgi:hypothetical protein